MKSAKSHPMFDPFKTKLTENVQSGAQQLDDQVKAKPKFWIEVGKLGSGWAAILLWDGPGFPEPWETGDGRYGEPEPAIAEARHWAEAEGYEFREPKPEAA